ncbi:unnamed protein product, partial [Larinioides sclopetarius]
MICKEMLQRYSSIKGKVEKFDNHVGVLMFLLTLSNSLNMYEFLNTYLLSDVPLNQKVIIVFHFLSTLLSFIATAVSAISVSDASNNFVSKAKSLSEISTSSIAHTFNFTLENNICLTVWKITVIRRSFIFGTIGGIFTYA